MDNAQDLDSLIERARIEAAEKRSTETAAAVVLKALAEAGGMMPVQALLRIGVRRDLIAYVVTDADGDKRRKSKARLAVIGDEPVVWLTSTGWQATGRASGREQIPTSDSIAHAVAPGRIEAWLREQKPTLDAYGITMAVLWGGACRRWSAELQARAWGALRTTADTNGAVGALTGGLVPDALVVERLPSGAQGERLYAALWGRRPGDEDDLAEAICAVEVEDTRKSDPLRHKVERWDAATEHLQAAQAVLWVVRSAEVARRLRDLGVDGPRRGRQILVPAISVGLDGADIGPVERPWWATRLAAATPSE